MRGKVERSHSLRTDYASDSPNSLRPKVSFNRAVHIKRINRKERLSDLIEDEPSGASIDKSPMAANGVNRSPSKFSTLPTRGQRNGVKKSSTPVPSDRLSRLIRHDPKPEDSPPPAVKSPSPPKKKTFGERVRGIFTKKGGKAQKEDQDDVKTRYSEFKGRNSSSDATDNEAEQYTGKRRGSAPETRSSWFRSIDRLKKTDNGRRERYFGESDRDSISPRRRLNDSSNESANEGETMSKAPSLVYLHTAAVGDIPHRAVTPTRRLSRSVSVLAPWAPKMRPPKATRSRATQTDTTDTLRVVQPPRQTDTLRVVQPPRQQVSSKNLPKLVFTGTARASTTRSEDPLRPLYRDPQFT